MLFCSGVIHFLYTDMKRNKEPGEVPAAILGMVRSGLGQSLKDCAENCIECNLCVKECAFLQKYGTPRRIAEEYTPTDSLKLKMSFECSICGLCSGVCPVDISPDQMFLEMRREAVDRGQGDFKEHATLRNYERRGTSRLFSLYGLPKGCRTIFFPGCALTGSRPLNTFRLFEYLEKHYQDLGLVMDCCTKPSHDLGRQGYFNEMFGEMKKYLKNRGIKNILTGCPSCYKIFSKYSDFKTQTVYEAMNEIGLPDTAEITGTVSIQDSCVVRFDASVQESIRSIAAKKNITIREMKHNGKKTLCCGEGAAVPFLNKKLAEKWGEKRQTETDTLQVMTYCAGCSHFLSKVCSTVHMVDVLFDPEVALAGKAKVSTSPMTYYNRLLLKRKFKKKFKYSVIRERNFISRK